MMKDAVGSGRAGKSGLLRLASDSCDVAGSFDTFFTANNPVPAIEMANVVTELFFILLTIEFVFGKEEHNINGRTGFIKLPVDGLVKFFKVPCDGLRINFVARFKAWVFGIPFKAKLAIVTVDTPARIKDPIWFPLASAFCVNAI